jgi:predicted membrane-bound spermidine synthase
MSETPTGTAPLDFDRADLSHAPQAVICTACAQPIGATYFGVNGNYVCVACRDRLVPRAMQAGSFPMALGLGLVAAALCAAAYYAITAATGWELGIVAIVVGVVIGKVVRKGAGLRKGKRYRALAMLLAYVAITATYVPQIMKVDDFAGSIVGAGLLALILPVLMLMKLDNVLGLIILAIGVYEAWKLSAAPELSVQGPFTLEATALRPTTNAAAD